MADLGRAALLLVIPVAAVAGVLRIDNLDEQSFIAVRRNLERDALQLVTIGKDL